MSDLPDVVVTNLHRRFTGVSATIKALVPWQQRTMDVCVVDWGDLGLGQSVRFRDILFKGWTAPKGGRFRVWHARRDVEILAGALLRTVLRQKYKVLFTSAAPKQPGRVLRRVISFADAIVATSARSAAFLDTHHAIIMHGVDTGSFVPPQNRQTAFAAMGMPGKFGIGLFGRIRPSKGTDLFVDAMIALLPRYPDFTAIITGLSKANESDYKTSLDRKIGDAGLSDRIVFVGDLQPDQVKQWYHGVSICVAASRVEGFGLTPLEAMASGCAVVTSKAGAWPWIVNEDIGALFETGSVESLCAALEPILARPERLDKLGAAARRRAVERHSIDGEVRAINDIYQRLMAGEDLPRLSRPG